MSLSDLMETFTKYKPDFDKIYEKYHKKDHVKSHDGANHCLVIGLIDQRIQLKMLQKLSDEYNSTNSTTVSKIWVGVIPKKITLTSCDMRRLILLVCINCIAF